MRKVSQEQQVIETLKREGGFATLRRLNEVVDFSAWATKTPEASVRRIVQNSKHIFKIQPGLWALEEMRDEVFRQFNLKIGNKKSEEHFSHSYYQGLLVEIGKFRNFQTYIPAQDKNKLFLNNKLSDIADHTELPLFTYKNICRKAKTIDVVWFNERNMPSSFYEVEHTTDIKNSLGKFYELQYFHANFFIVADTSRKREFEDKLNESVFKPIKNRVSFLEYNRVAGMYESLTKVSKFKW